MKKISWLIFTIVAVCLVRAVVIMAIFNWICDGIFTFNDITFFQALFIAVFIRFAFGGSGEASTFTNKAVRSIEKACKKLEDSNKID